MQNKEKREGPSSDTSRGHERKIPKRDRSVPIGRRCRWPPRRRGTTTNDCDTRAANQSARTRRAGLVKFEACRVGTDSLRPWIGTSRVIMRRQGHAKLAARCCVVASEGAFQDAQTCDCLVHSGLRQERVRRAPRSRCGKITNAASQREQLVHNKVWALQPASKDRPHWVPFR
jgi:hypothetical protein